MGARRSGARAARVRVASWVALVGAAATLFGCGSSGSGSANQVAATGTQAASVTPEPPVPLHLDEGNFATTGSQATISGRAPRGASVTVNGNPVSVSNGRWKSIVPLHIGQTGVTVEASASGEATTIKNIEIVRHHSSTELAVLARVHAEHVAARQLHEHQELEKRQQALKELEAESPPEGESTEGETPEEESTESECPNGTYENSNGNIVCKPYTPENGERPAGATAECEDGTFSFSEHRSGTCSGHGGVKEWLN